MSVAAKRRAISGMTLAVVAACGLLLAFALQRLVQTEAEIAGGFGESLVWAFNQAQHEGQSLVVSAHEWNDSERRAEDAERLNLQLDLAISRLDLLSQGTLGRAAAQAGEAGAIKAARADLMSFDAVLQAAIAQKSAIGKLPLETLLTDVSRLRAAATRVLLAERENIARQRDQYSSVLSEAIVAVLLILGCGVFIVARLLASLRSAAQAEDALRRDRDFSNLLLESSGDGVIAFDTEFRCTHWNSAMGEMFPALCGSDVVGRNIQDAYQLPDGHVILNMLRDTLEGESIHMPAHPIPAGGRYVEKFTHPIWSGKAIVGGILFIRDVTDAHLARLELVKHRDQLEAIVQERTRDLEESLTRETRLRELYKGFVSMVSHQFRTPLSIVDSSAQRMIRRGKEMSEAEIRERAGKIRTAALRLTRLVSSTLNATKVDAGEIDVAIRRCDLGRLVEEACERQKETDPDREFRLRLDRLPPLVPCDPLLIDQAIANLLSNAVKYSAPPDPVDISADVEGPWVRLRVCDRGVGISEEERPKLFERFFRAKTAAGVEGTGIGLHFTRTIARMHGGDVEALPREGGGSSFILSIPIEDPAT